MSHRVSAESAAISLRDPYCGPCEIEVTGGNGVVAVRLLPPGVRITLSAQDAAKLAVTLRKVIELIAPMETSQGG